MVHEIGYIKLPPPTMVVCQHRGKMRTVSASFVCVYPFAGPQVRTFPPASRWRMVQGAKRPGLEANCQSGESQWNVQKSTLLPNPMLFLCYTPNNLKAALSLEQNTMRYFAKPVKRQTQQLWREITKSTSKKLTM